MNASDVLLYANRTLHRGLLDLPADHWETGGVCGWWSVKNIVAHLASFELLLVEILNTYQGEAATPLLDQFQSVGNEEFNTLQVAQRREMSPNDTLGEYNDAHAQTRKLIALIPAETLRQPGTLPWYGMEYALDDFIVYMYYGHKREHTAQINVFKDTLKTENAQEPQI